MLEEINKTVTFLQSKISQTPEFAIVLGTGLGKLANEIEQPLKIPYTNIPNFPVSTVQGHSGNLIFGKLGGKQVVAMQGRFHYYEGYNMNQVVFPIRVFKLLGINKLILSNASGGVNPTFKIGDIMIITDHINLFPDNPLRGKNINELGPRFPDMSEPYDQQFIKLLKEIGNTNNLDLKQGVYAGTSGPTFETPAEYIYMRNIGADTVGMSTVPEVIAAKHMNMRCAALSVITDIGGGPEVEQVSHELVQIEAQKAEPILTNIVKTFITKA